MSDWMEVERRLKDRIDDVARKLLPEGRLIGTQWVCGDLSGRRGDSLKLDIAGPNVGVWCDFADSDSKGKTVISLWTAQCGGNFQKAISEARDWLGYDDTPHRRRLASPSGGGAASPVDSGVAAVRKEWELTNPVAVGEPVGDHLVTGRKLEPAALTAYGVRQVIKKGQWVIVWPYWPAPAEDVEQRVRVFSEAADQEPAWLKFELLSRPQGKKKEWTTRAPEKTLFGLNVAHPEGRAWRHILLCEGEKDALTWFAVPGIIERDILPLSVPFGAKWRGQDKHRPSPNRDWIDRCWDWLSAFETVYVAMDADDPGRHAAEDIINEIGPARCRYVELPEKDVNAMACGGEPAWEDQALQAVEQARDFAPERIKRAGSYRDALHQLWFGEDSEKGMKLPIEVPFRIRRGETTVWTGHTGSGKTTFLQFVMAGLMSQGERVLIASMETKGVRTVDKLVRQVWGRHIYSAEREKYFRERGATAEELENFRAACVEDGDEVLNWLDGRCWLYDHAGIANWRQLIEAFRWARHRLGINHFVVDNFMRIGIVKDDYAQQAQAVTEFAGLGMELDAHIHLVVHRKKETGRGGGSTRDVGGAQEISGNAFNFVEIERDEQKGHRISELLAQEAELGAEEYQRRKQELAQEADGKFILRKQREGEVQDFSKYLYFMWQGQQYSDHAPGHEQHRPINFIRDTYQPTNNESYEELL